MYTGTLIRDLLRTVERAEQTVRQKQLADERELQILITSQLSLMQDLTVLLGAA